MQYIHCAVELVHDVYTKEHSHCLSLSGYLEEQLPMQWCWHFLSGISYSCRGWAELA